MRVVWITPGFAADAADTDAVPYLQVLARALHDQGVDLHIVTLEYPFSSRAYQWYGISVYPCNGQNRRFRKPAALYAAFIMVWRLCKDQKNVAVHSFWWDRKTVLTECLMRLWRWWGQHGKRAPLCTHFCTLMGQEVHPDRKFNFRNCARQMQQRLVAISAFQDARLLQHAGFRAGQIIEWGISDSDVVSSASALRNIDIIGVGSLNAVKNWPLWIRVVAQVRLHLPDIRALLVGQGPESANIEQYIRAEGLEDNIALQPAPARPVALAAMRRSKVLLHTADFEGFGYVLTEAAALGCRVVSTPVGIAPAVARCGQDEVQLTQQVLQALSEPACHQSVVPWRAADTAQAYRTLWQSRIQI
jgi:glycosyltransferase involved in cell wall biosynthesis